MFLRVLEKAVESLGCFDNAALLDGAARNEHSTDIVIVNIIITMIIIIVIVNIIIIIIIYVLLNTV